MDIRARIQQMFVSALSAQGIADPVIELEYPALLAHGDFACNAALAYAKELKTNPRALAETLVAHIGTIDGVAKIEVAGPGFINFTLSAHTIDTVVNYSTAQGDAWGSTDARKNEQIMVEYTDPNPFKEFHIGHLMSNAIGESIARLLESQGIVVVRANYQGDVGMHVACALWGIKQLGIDASDAAQHGKAYAYGATARKEDEHVAEEIKNINKAIYDGVLTQVPSEWYTLYQTGREASLARFEEMYATLGTRFDTYYFESVVGVIGKDIVQKHPRVFVESDGARVFKGEEYGLHTRVFLNAEGLPTYEAKELGLEKQKMIDYPRLSQMIIVTANEITEYFKVLKKAMEQVYPDIAARLTHVAHGMMKLPTGKMSSRTGDVITGASLLESLRESALKRAQESRADTVDELAAALAVGAIKYQVLKQATGKDIIFEQERALSLEGDSGPYLQYTHARCCSIIEKAGAQKSSEQSTCAGAPTDVERLITRFPHIVERAAHEYAPHHVAQYLLELASAFNSFYAQEHILDGSAQQAHKVAIVQAVQTTLKNGLHLLGISAPTKM